MKRSVWLDDVDAVELLEIEQVGIAGDDEIGGGGDGASEDRIVGRIIGHGRRDRGRRCDRDDRAVVGEELGGRGIDACDALRKLRVAEHALQLGQQRVAGEALEGAGERKTEEFVGRAAPEQRGERYIGVKNDSHRV